MKSRNEGTDGSGRPQHRRVTWDHFALPLLALAIAWIWSPPSHAQFFQEHTATSFAHQDAIDRPGAGAEASVEMKDVRYRMRVTIPGTVRPVSEETSRLLSRWGEVLGTQNVVKQIRHEILVKEGAASHWVPIAELLLPAFQKEVKPGAAYDLYVQRLGALPSHGVYLVNGYIAAGPDRPLNYRLAEVVISLQRIGHCPNFSMAIHGDGRVTRDEGTCSGSAGRMEWKVEQQRIVDLLNHLYRIRFHEMRADYNSSEEIVVNDGAVEVMGLTMVASHGSLSGKIITLKIGDYEKRVVTYDHPSSPQELVTLPAMIEEVAESGRRAAARPSP